ncbi:hypothetical protein OAN307_c15830 [Octadecabacter antarcticus 307]|uniref:FRG domain-containing protein n=1 Tax=Octadecabacter antarcticus 307 TaxID=391626 RepID=M9RA55_9RHOB|nr:FRG domain-containing protein [Octadecabacter antarcticus]AGI67256.1 hypothetical protein OAN307_c15830 [Octadecabacter antarcticus 307]
MFPYIVLDLDKSSGGSVGRATLISQDRDQPSASCSLEIKTNKKVFEKEVTFLPIDPLNGRRLNVAEVRDFFPNSTLPTTIKLRFERLSRNELRIKAVDESQATIQVVLNKESPPRFSYLDASYEVYNWKTFKEAVSEKQFHSFVFRGQAEPFSLQTTFHRTDRKDLVRYLEQDVRQLHHSISGVIDHVFNPDIPRDLGALLNLAQHHGFPTPLLDWTYSPFIAAWFAFSKFDKKRIKFSNREDKVRVFCLDKVELEKAWQFKSVGYSTPHTSLIDALPIENNRAVSQQGVLMLTNIQDVEDHIFNLGQAANTEMLTAFDLPASEAETALNELALMGITRSTLMPGLDSICSDLRHRLF